jgi:hypothetical protein
MNLPVENSVAGSAAPAAASPVFAATGRRIFRTVGRPTTAGCAAATGIARKSLRLQGELPPRGAVSGRCSGPRVVQWSAAMKRNGREWNKSPGIWNKRAGIRNEKRAACNAPVTDRIRPSSRSRAVQSLPRTRIGSSRQLRHRPSSGGARLSAYGIGIWRDVPRPSGRTPGTTRHLRRPALLGKEVISLFPGNPLSASPAPSPPCATQAREP